MTKLAVLLIFLFSAQASAFPLRISSSLSKAVDSVKELKGMTSSQRNPTSVKKNKPSVSNQKDQTEKEQTEKE